MEILAGLGAVLTIGGGLIAWVLKLQSRLVTLETWRLHRDESWEMFEERQQTFETRLFAELRDIRTRLDVLSDRRP